MLAVALEYASKGWEVFPLKGKVPYTAHGHLDASSDPAMVRRWWRHWPMANIGARVPGRLLVLDIDPRNGGDSAALGELPETLTCLSGRGDGGRHLYFLRSPCQLSSTRLPAGIDLKANGYVVMPPSLHPVSGQPYRWLGEHAVQPLPLHLLELLRLRPAARIPAMASQIATDGLTRLVRRSVPGNRNAALYWAACRAMERGGGELLAALVDAAMSTGLSEVEAMRTITSAQGRAVA